MCSIERLFGVTEPGDSDYPLRVANGSADSLGEIRKRCGKDNPWEDPDFPANDSSIGKDKKKVGDSARGEEGNAPSKFVWLRAADITTKGGLGNPNFAVVQPDRVGDLTRISALDIRQGGLGDCWYLASVATLTSHPDQLNIVIPEDNYTGFDEDKYCGAFHFRFYNFYAGKFTDVVVDDRIPCRASDGWPAFAKISSDGDKTNEFWAALIEKAYAKYRGTYSTLAGGGTATAYRDFTGGFSQWWYMRDYRKQPEKQVELGAKVKKYLDADAFMGLACPDAKDAVEFAEGYTKYGMVGNHAYSVLGYAEVAEKDNLGNTHLLMQIRNPWGSGEWTGPYSDTDDEDWAQLEKDLRRKTASGECNTKDGAFWMEFSDMVKYFNNLDYCLYGLDGGKKKYVTLRSEWPGSLQSAKINPWDRETFHLNPAFSFKLGQSSSSSVSCSLRIVAGDPRVGDQTPYPKFHFFIHEIREEEELEDLRRMYQNEDRIVHKEQTSNWDRIESSDFALSPGTYVLTVTLNTVEEPLCIPAAYHGKPLPFAVYLFAEAEEKPELIPLPFGPLSDTQFFGRRGDTKVGKLASKWPAELQAAKIVPHKRDQLHLCPAFSFRVERELDWMKIPKEQEGKCRVAFRIGTGDPDGVAMNQFPKFMWLLYEFREGDEESICYEDDKADLEGFYKIRKRVEWSGCPHAGKTVTSGDLYLTPGRYVLALPPKTDEEPPVIPDVYRGKSIPFTLTLFSENEAGLSALTHRPIPDNRFFGRGGDTKVATVDGEWPPELQTAKIVPHGRSQLHMCPAWTFEVKRELLAVQIPGAEEGKCMVGLRVRTGEEGVEMEPKPKYMWQIFEIQEGDGDPAADLRAFYKKRSFVEWSSYALQTSVVVHKVMYFKPGRYVIVIPPKTDEEPPVIPEVYRGQPIPFTLTLFTENETELKPIIGIK